jgi:signal transduction histidine kinase
MPDSPPEIAALKQVPFFAHLDGRRLQELVAAGHRLSVGAQQVVFEEGDEPDGMYVLLEGRARLVRRDDSGHELQLTTFHPGGFFGELALLEGRPRSATVITVDRCELFVVKQDEFMACLAATPPDVVVRVVAALSRMIRDATERHWRQDLAREKLHADMEIARHRAVGQMVAGVAHELNTPLGIANTAADLIEKRCRDRPLGGAAASDPALRAVVDDVREASRLLRGNVLRAHRLVESFKQVSARQVSATVETVDVAQVVSETLDLFKINARRAHLAIRFADRREPSEGTWTGSPSHLTQVLLNLLTNVERYAYPGGEGGAVEIELATTAVAGRPAIELTVRDFGRGIAPEHRAHVFEPFFTTGRGHGGTGLGLATVHNLVTAVLGGTIRLDSELGAGTSVTVTLPSMQPRSDPMI